MEEKAYPITEEFYDYLLSKVGLIPLGQESTLYLDLDSYVSGGTTPIHSVIVRQTKIIPKHPAMIFQNPKGIKVI